MNRKVKIVATIGPASQEDAVVEKLLQAGMDVARLNFSHGTHETHAARISQLRIHLDAPGPAPGIVTGSSRSEDPSWRAACTRCHWFLAPRFCFIRKAAANHKPPTAKRLSRWISRNCLTR